MPTDGACRFESPRLDEAVVARLVDCHARHGPGIALLGDSHSRGLYRGYFEEWDGPFLFGMVEGFCQPYGTRNVCDLDGFTDLVAQMPEVFSAIHFNQNGRGLLETTEGEPLSFRRFGLTGSIDAKRYRPAADRLAAVLAYISRLNQHVPVVWIGPRIEPQIPEDVLISRGCMARYDLRPGQRQLFEDLDRASAEAAATQGIGYISYISQIAATNFDMAQDFMTCEALYWIDGDHWSSAGAARFVGRMIAADALPLP